LCASCARLLDLLPITSDLYRLYLKRLLMSREIIEKTAVKNTEKMLSTITISYHRK
jgi:hypothetical protein